MQICSWSTWRLWIAPDKPSTIPMDRNHHLGKDDKPPLSDPMSYHKLVGKLIYLLITRIDITHAMTSLSQHMQAPTKAHMDVALKVLWYLKGSLRRGLHYRNNTTLEIVGHCDVDWAMCPTTRRSITRYHISLRLSLISWKSKKQLVVSRSFVEAEYHSMAHATMEITFIQYLLKDFNILSTKEVTLHCTKYNEIDCHFVHEKIQSAWSHWHLLIHLVNRQTSLWSH